MCNLLEGQNIFYAGDKRNQNRDKYSHYNNKLDTTQEAKSANNSVRCRKEADPVSTFGRGSARGRGLYPRLHTESVPDRGQKEEMLHKRELKWEENAGTI
ncbi:unnamed protein product [Meloidogyne enterolobii]|uniref:Uncharacterized protein n=1 Tax=Meloidogyne enterolobii TaxID=390850 RepID=A0ACB0Z3N3_MELEN